MHPAPESQRHSSALRPAFAGGTSASDIPPADHEMPDGPAAQDATESSQIHRPPQGLPCNSQPSMRHPQSSIDCLQPEEPQPSGAPLDLGEPGREGCAAVQPPRVTRRDTIRRLLLVDDEESILSALMRVLRREKYEILTARCATEAIQVMEEQPVHLVISDHRMPATTGIELLREIRRRWPETIRIVLSGYSEVSTILSAINEGAIYKFLTKPWNDEELRLNIRRALEQFDLEEENRMLIHEIAQQNKLLQELNAQLDQRVIDANTGLYHAQTMLDAADVGVVAIDESGLVVYINRFASRFLQLPDGAPGSSPVGLPVQSLLPAEFFAAIYDSSTSLCVSKHAETETHRDAHGELTSDQTRLPCQEGRPRCNTLGRAMLSGQTVQWRVNSLANTERTFGQVLLLWEDTP